jgi:hypothetical protein
MGGQLVIQGWFLTSAGIAQDGFDLWGRRWSLDGFSFRIELISRYVILSIFHEMKDGGLYNMGLRHSESRIVVYFDISDWIEWPIICPYCVLYFDISNWIVCP